MEDIKQYLGNESQCLVCRGAGDGGEGVRGRGTRGQRLAYLRRSTRHNLLGFSDREFPVAARSLCLIREMYKATTEGCGQFKF